MIGHHRKQRAFFILSEPFTHLYNANHADKLLRITRAVCRYRFFKGNIGAVYQALLNEIKLLLKNETKIAAIEKEFIKTTKDYIDTERSMLHSSKGIDEESVRLINMHFCRVLGHFSLLYEGFARIELRF